MDQGTGAEGGVLADDPASWRQSQAARRDMRKRMGTLTGFRPAPK